MSRKVKKVKKPAKVFWLARNDDDYSDVEVFSRKPRITTEVLYDWGAGENREIRVFHGAAHFDLCAAGLRTVAGISLKKGECIAVRVTRARG